MARRTIRAARHPRGLHASAVIGPAGRCSVEVGVGVLDHGLQLFDPGLDPVRVACTVDGRGQVDLCLETPSQLR